MTGSDARPGAGASSPLRVEGDRLTRDGESVFLLADTLWAAFSQMSTDEWREALRLRRRQGFNAVNISVLPIAHDRSTGEDERQPFRLRADGSWDLDRLDDGYFAVARTMVQLAVEEGLVPVLVVLWCNYVPGTWGAAITPQTVLDEEQTERYVTRVLETFADHHPVFCISGDERFDDEAATARYQRVLRRVRAGAPDCLTTMHSTPDATLPPVLAEDPALSYYSYQSGHDDAWEERAQQLPERYRSLPVARPVVSMEPCYEGHGYGSGAGRHTGGAVRRASWTGVLAGAGAGLGYGAHGAWSWHRAGQPFNGTHFSGTPFPASRAMELPGAWDVGLLRRVVEQEGLFDLRSRDDLVVDDRSGVRLGMSPAGDRVALYLPHPFPVEVAADLAGWRLRTWDLSRGRRDHVRIQHAAGASRLEQPDFLGDALHVLVRPGASGGGG
ncbi:apiosidase-like domain-containing protein [Auraticoccus monumenti]|uniref:Apiosidase-like catalytic domain-containing protein n=1 Tax=Auraticoccus monumenti TaxID=675864 RepID=A0A1G6YZ07_9ACTN|nr:DUF4038 domain-containing protein [Auraticoccus monumenti]SDD94857.1 Protein of unknown function [Auraticoccus monumenti]